MSASKLPTAAPTNSLRVWCDTHYIYAELPSKLGAECPYILSYPRTGKGFGDLLSMLYGPSDCSGLMPENFRPGRKLVGTSTQHATAAATLRRMGIVK